MREVDSSSLRVQTKLLRIAGLDDCSWLLGQKSNPFPCHFRDTGQHRLPEVFRSFDSASLQQRFKGEPEASLRTLRRLKIRLYLDQESEKSSEGGRRKHR